MNYDELKSEILESSTKDLYQKYYTGESAWYFSGYLLSKDPFQRYDEFKKFVSNRLEVDANNVAIAGSGKTGFSLSPKKNLRPFDGGEKPSDIDLIIVSGELFDRFWDAYLQALYDQKIFSYNKLAKSIFRRFVDIHNGSAEHHPDFRKWITKVNGFQRDIDIEFEFGHRLNYRIFKSWTYAEAYYCYGLKLLQQNLQSDNLKKKLTLPASSESKKYYLASVLNNMSRKELIELLELLKNDKL